jgi:hypothetical protein
MVHTSMIKTVVEGVEVIEAIETRYYIRGEKHEELRQAVGAAKGADGE